MKEERLYKLAYECLLGKWRKAYEDVLNYPSCEFFRSIERELWNELCTLEREMLIISLEYEVKNEISQGSNK